MPCAASSPRTRCPNIWRCTVRSLPASTAFRETQKEEAAPATHPAGVRKPTRLYRLYYLTTGIAAALLLCIGIAGLLPHATPARTGYAIIDGRYCDDPQLVQAKALEALQNVGFTEEELKETITLPNLLP